MTRSAFAALALAAAAAGGCHTGVGEYFDNRGRDFWDCWRAEAGEGYGLAVSVKAAGLMDVGVGLSGATIGGWWYGVSPWLLEAPNDVEQWFPFTPLRGAAKSCLHDDFCERGHRVYEHSCWLVLPALFSTGRRRDAPEREWIWTKAGSEGCWSRLHAFDVELSLTLLVGRLRLGFSPGEFVDFLLGWFGLDIAGDDRRWSEPDG